MFVKSSQWAMLDPIELVDPSLPCCTLVLG